MGQRGNQNEGLKIPQDKWKQIHNISKIHEIQQKMALREFTAINTCTKMKALKEIFPTSHT